MNSNWYSEMLDVYAEERGWPDAFFWPDVVGAARNAGVVERVLKSNWRPKQAASRSSFYELFRNPNALEWKGNGIRSRVAFVKKGLSEAEKMDAIESILSKSAEMSDN